MQQDDFISMYYSFLQFEVLDKIWTQYAICDPLTGMKETEFAQFCKEDQKCEPSPELFREALNKFQTVKAPDNHLSKEGSQN